MLGRIGSQRSVRLLQQRQQMIDHYEHVIAAKDQVYQDLREDLEPTRTAIDTWPIPSVQSRIETVITRLKRLPNK